MKSTSLSAVTGMDVNKLRTRNPADAACLQNAATTGSSIRWDLTKVKNGEFLTWSLSTIPDSWTRGTVGIFEGFISQVTSGVGVAVGSSSVMKLKGSSPLVYQDILVQSGKPYTFSAAIRASTPGGGAAFVKIQNLETRSWLTTGGAWKRATTGVGCLTAATSAVATNNQTITIEGYGKAGKDTHRLRIYAMHANGSTAFVSYFDRIIIYPHIDFISVHGYHKATTIKLKVQSSTDASTWTARTTGILYGNFQASAYSRLPSAIAARHWRLQFSGQQHNEYISIGEVVFGHATETTARRTYAPSPVAYSGGDITAENTLGVMTRYRRSAWNNKTRAVSFKFLTTSKINDFVGIIERGRDYPMVMVIDDSKREVLYGHIVDAYTVAEEPYGSDSYYSVKLKFAEMPYTLQ